MSGMVFPDYYVGKLFPPRKSVLGSRKRQSALSGKRSTISYRAYPLYQWEVSFDSGNGGVLRDDIVRANYVAYSQAADQWTASNTGSGLLPKVFTNGIQAPDGTWTGDQVFLNKGTGSAGTDVSQLMAPSAAARAVGSMFTYSVWLRTLDGSTAVVALPKSAGGNFLCTVTPVWQRFSFSQAITAAIAGSAADFVGPALIGGAGTANYANLGVWGAQIEPGQFAGAYVRTFGAAVQHGDLKSLFGFYSAMVTAADTFLFMDPDFNSVQNHLFGLGTGGQTVYQLMATYNGGNQYPGPYDTEPNILAP
jgi:hypothetical protein